MPAAHSGGDRNSRRQHWQAAGPATAGDAGAFAWLRSQAACTREYALATEPGRRAPVMTVPGLQFTLPYQSGWALNARPFGCSPQSTEFLTLKTTQVVATGASVCGSTIAGAPSGPRSSAPTSDPASPAFS